VALQRGAAEVDGPFDIKAGPEDGALWFTNKSGNTIGRIGVSAGYPWRNSTTSPSAIT